MEKAPLLIVLPVLLLLSLSACSLGDDPQGGNESAFPVVWDTDWFAAPTRTDVLLNMGTTDYDFVVGSFTTWKDSGGELLSPLMGAVHSDYAPAYVSLSGTTVYFMEWLYLARLNNLSDSTDLLVEGADIRLRAIRKTPAYDSGWTTCTVNTTYNLPHNLGELPTFAFLEAAENPDGSGWRVPVMASATNDGGSWRQTSLVKLDTANAVIRTQTNLARFRSSATGTITSPNDGYFRLRLYTVSPDYDSGWTAISTTAGDRNKWFNHNLGQEPSLVMLYLTENPDLSGWTVIALSPYCQNYDSGTCVYDIDNDWAVIKGGAGSVALFVDELGSAQSPTTGYVRFLAWR